MKDEKNVEMSLDDKLEILIINQAILNEKLDILINKSKKDEEVLNASMFIQGYFLGDLFKNYGNL